MSRTIDASELSAYVDGDLAPARMAEVERAAAGDPALRRHLDELLADHAILRDLARAESKDLGEIPPRLTRLADRLDGSLRTLAAQRERTRSAGAWATLWRQVAGLAAAAAVGWTAASWAAPGPDALSDFIDEVTEVHRVTALAPGFSLEATGPVIDSLGQLFAHKLTPPDLSDAGFALSRVDVAATDSGPAAVFFFTDPEARRVSLVLSLDSPILDALRHDTAVPRVTTHDGLAVAYGERNGVAFALVGSIPEPNARQLAMRAARALSN